MKYKQRMINRKHRIAQKKSKLKAALKAGATDKSK
jgi:hypothetical protein